MLVKLVDDIRARFVARGFTDVAIVDGLESTNDQTNYGAGGAANRVAFVPAEDIEIGPPIGMGENDDGKRELLNLHLTFEVHIAGFVPTSERDLMHRRRCIDIFEIVVQETQYAYAGVSSWTSARWNNERKQGRLGAELVATLVINVPIFDIAWELAEPHGVPGDPKPVEEP